MIAITERLFLRVFEETDVEAAKSFWGDEEVMEHCNGAIPYEMLENGLAGYKACHEKLGISVFAVVEKESQTVIGAAGFNVRTTPETVELIYHFSKAAWGKGYATEAAEACIAVVKKHPGVKKLFASVDPQNLGSIKILEKIGFDYKGKKWFDDTNQEESYFEMNL
ncbi:GNAT family N-acetyltransferase [Bacillus sp. B-jedd]|uniref:GNAT family N-acetyltransferase n=1 Tax=Bacillus sp. B-jedd TaxID=1476857 RepID=UPI000515728F|nr:GNAT family N-acetyltransferase [Bacillus sp. B-jedd]CEG26373.1 ribosomal-protein-alanine acetyltransferase [Bacillus sp. B-jedd]